VEEGEALGLALGDLLGLLEGDALGFVEGAAVGEAVEAVGAAVVGEAVGTLGAAVGAKVGCMHLDTEDGERCSSLLIVSPLLSSALHVRVRERMLPNSSSFLTQKSNGAPFNVFTVTVSIKPPPVMSIMHDASSGPEYELL